MKRERSAPAIPPLFGLREKKLRALGRKLDRLVDAAGFKQQNLLWRHADQAGALLWHLARHGLVLQEVRSAGLVRLLAEHVDPDVSAADLIAVLRRLPPDLAGLDRGAARTWATLTPEVLPEVDALLVAAHLKDPAALLAARAELPDNLRLAIDFVRRRAGEAIDAGASAALLRHLVAHHCEHGLHLGLDVPRIVGGARVESRLTSTARVIELAGLLGPPQAWAEAALEWLLPRVEQFRSEAEALSERALAGLRLASLPDLVYLFGDGWWSPEALLRALDARADAPAALFAAAARLRAEGTRPFRIAAPQVAPDRRARDDDDDDDAYDDDADDDEDAEAPDDHERVCSLAELMTVVGIERAIAAGEAVPHAVDAHFDLRRVFESDADYIPRLRAAIAALGPRRAHAIIRGVLARPWFYGKAAAICDLHFEPGLVEHVFSFIDAGEHGVDAGLLGHCEPAIVPLAAAHARAHASAERAAAYEEAILYALARASAAGKTWEPAWDEHIHLERVRFSHGGGKVEPVLAMLDRLSGERHARVLAVNRPRCADEPWRLVRALRVDTPPASLAAIFADLAARRAQVTAGALGDRLRRLGSRVVEPLTRALAEGPAEHSFMRELERALDGETFAALKASLRGAIETPH